jgi:23S rRNA (adenine2503-C2)-methyltransferase
MSDLGKALRERLAADAGIGAPQIVRDSTAADGTRKWLLDVGSAQRDRVGLHSRRRSRHAVHLVAGRLRARLRVLLDRQAGLQPQPHDGEIVGQLWHANRALLATASRAVGRAAARRSPTS